MSKFERGDPSSAWADARELQFPEDFSPEEAAFARQLRDLFAVGEELIPPLYAQTLLEEERFHILSESFENRVITEVFGSLRLELDAPDPLLHQPATRHADAVTRAHPDRRPTAVARVRTFLLTTFQHMNRPLAMGVGLFLLFMVLAIALASPLRAEGIRVFLGNTGVIQVKAPPSASTSTVGHRKGQKESSAANPAVEYDPSMPLFWPGRLAGQYAYEGTVSQQPTQWSKGVIVDVQYSVPGASAGSGMLDIREFQVASAYSAVLQVVATGNFTSLTLSDGEAAVYVNGMWQQRMLDHTIASTWQTGTHCLLIMERQGVVIWMTADPRDGANVQTMTSIANQLVTVNWQTLQRNKLDNTLLAAASFVASVDNPVGSECYLLVPPGISPASGVGQFVFNGSTVIGSSSGVGGGG